MLRCVYLPPSYTYCCLNACLYVYSRFSHLFVGRSRAGMDASNQRHAPNIRIRVATCTSLSQQLLDQQALHGQLADTPSKSAAAFAATNSKPMCNSAKQGSLFWWVKRICVNDREHLTLPRLWRCTSCQPIQLMHTKTCRLTRLLEAVTSDYSAACHHWCGNWLQRLHEHPPRT